MILQRTLLLLLFVTISLSNTWANTSAAVVQGLQMPAWVERDGQRRALTANQPLQSGDKIITGKSARVLLALEEGSHIKLGENAQLNLAEVQAPEQPSGVFTGLVDVLSGAFRFTTSLIGATRQRNIDFRIGTVTAGIRGTDIWGRSNNEKDIVCLIEGKINVASGNDNFDMSDPLSFYIKPKNAPADPVSRVSEEQLTQWAQETELQKGFGVVQDNGRYALNIMSVQSLNNAQLNQNTLSHAGYASEIHEANVSGQTWYRLRITHLASHADARQLSERLQQDIAVGTPWISTM